MAISQGALAPVLVLPAAASSPVLNPRWRGRYPVNVVRLRARIALGDLVSLTTGGDQGVLGVVEEFVHPPPGEDTRWGRWLRVRAVDGVFRHCVNVRTNKPSAPTLTVLAPTSTLRRRVLPVADRDWAWRGL